MGSESHGGETGDKQFEFFRDPPVLRVSGCVHENSGLEAFGRQIAPQLQGLPELNVDLVGLINMNSVGVRSWLLFLEDVQRRVGRIAFHNVSETFVDLCNVIPDILGNARSSRIESFCVPFFCGACSERFTIPLALRDAAIRDGAFDPPKSVRPLCSKPAEFDGLPSDFSGFLKRR